MENSNSSNIFFIVPEIAAKPGYNDHLRKDRIAIHLWIAHNSTVF